MRIVLAALFMVFAAATLATAETRVALVIGNSAYVNTTALANTRNDARAVATKLTAIGFDVSLHEDLDGQAFRVALGEFSEKAQNADLVLVYYAGHGIEMNGKNYLIPVDARMRSEATAEFETVALEQVLSAVREAGILGMVMLDACRNNPFANTMQRKNGTRAVSRGLAPVSVEGERGLIVSFAAEAGQTADDGDGQNSPYAAALLQVLDQPGLEVGRMFRSVRAKVREATNGQQVPIEQMQLPDTEIYLVPAATVTPPVADGGTTAITPPTEDPMVIYLDAVRSGDPQQLKGYLSRFPTHEMADQARRILLDYADDDLWNSTVSRDTARDYRVYLMAFPTGRHLAEAQARLDDLERVAQPVEPQVPEFQIFGNLDLVGGDLTATGYRGIPLESCQAQCAADTACLAFTYVQDKQWCWTKGSIGAREVRAGMISAIKTTPSVQPTLEPQVEASMPVQRTFKLYADLDILGHDLTDAGIKNISLADCEGWCRANSSCTAFSYVQKQNWCWPKYGAGATAPTRGIISGQAE
jgi:Caspase domain/PAN domain